MLTLGSGTLKAQAWYSGGMVQPPTGIGLAQAATGGALSNGTYYVQVSAYNANGESSPSAEASIVLNGGGSAQKITVTWTAPASGPAPTGYRVYISQVSGYETAQGTAAASPYDQTIALTTNGAQARFVGLLTIGEVGGDCELDITWQDKDFYGQSVFPVTRAFYGGKGTMKAKKVELSLVNLDNLISQTTFAQVGVPGSGTDSYAFSNATTPGFVYLQFIHTRSDVAGKTVTIEAYKATSKSLSLPFIREDISTRDFDFDLLVDSSLSNAFLKVSATQ